MNKNNNNSIPKGCC